MAFATIFRLGARAAALVAMSALLLQACCPAQFTAVAVADTVRAAGSPCHEMPPSTPENPTPRHKCCTTDRLPEALPSVAQAMSGPSTGSIEQSPALQMNGPAAAFSNTSASLFSRHGLLQLRI